LGPKLNRRNLLKSGLALSAASLAGPLATAAEQQTAPNSGAQQSFQPTWNSLRNVTIPQWLRDGKFGIYTHWGIYSVPAYGENGTWYAHNAYTRPNSDERKHHEATYGPLEKFGYKDFIPMLTGSRFDPEEWAELFKHAGARFAGPVAEHHDGFAMWDTKYSEWNAAKMGPKRNVVGELAKTIKAQGMKFLTTFHHAENWFYFPTWDTRYDVSDPRYAGLYGESHRPGALPDKEFLDRWIGKLIEVVDAYGPDFVWFDFGLQLIQQRYKEDFLAYFYNRAAGLHRDVIVSYKYHDLTPGVGIIDLEQGRESSLTYNEWITDMTIDAGDGWGYIQNLGFKPADQLITGLVDRVSKNGYLLLNVGPRPDGTIPDPAKERLLAMGKWLEVNGESIYDTSPWLVAAEGPTQIAKTGAFNEATAAPYTAQDVRYTCRDHFLYATCLAWPNDKASFTSLVPKGERWTGLYPSEIASISMLGSNEPVQWKFTPEALELTVPKTRPCESAFVYRIALRKPFES
jgi:alpha-L-fucosidase